MLPAAAMTWFVRNIGHSTEKKFKEMGLDMPESIKNEIQAAREGELPKSIKDKL